MQTSFQDGCNTIYNAVKAKGITPSSKSPADISTAISSIKTDTKHVFKIQMFGDKNGWYYRTWIDGEYGVWSGKTLNGNFNC